MLDILSLALRFITALATSLLHPSALCVSLMFLHADDSVAIIRSSKGKLYEVTAKSNPFLNRLTSPLSKWPACVT